MINLKDGELADVSPFKGDPKNYAFSYAIKKMMQFILEKRMERGRIQLFRTCQMTFWTC